MKSILKKISQGLLVIPVMVLGVSMFSLATAVPAYAQEEVDCTDDANKWSVACGAVSAKGGDQPASLFGAEDGVFKTIVEIMLFIVGAIAVIMLIIGGIRYITSGGAQDQITAAKNTIMYSIIGIIVALLAYAIVQFVVGGLS